jgi:hypothetical protein
MRGTRAPTLAGTRQGWHRLAEHVLAAGQFASAGTIRLRPSPGGFATTVGIGGRQLAVVGAELEVVDGGDRRRVPLTTLRDVAAAAGVTPGLRGPYQPATSADLDAPLGVDPLAAGQLADWFALGDAALRRVAEELGRPQEPVLWPEHFDVGITLDAVNYGCSLGDDAVGEPYLYVGPHEGPPTDDPFWNAPFGAVADAGRIASVEDAVTFFQRGRALIERSRT